MSLYAIAKIYKVNDNIDRYIPKLERRKATERTILNDLLPNRKYSLMGYRILNTNNKMYVDANLSSVLGYLTQGNKIEGLNINEEGRIEYIYSMNDNSIKKVNIPTLIIGLEYKSTGDEYWIAISKSNKGLEIINRFGKIKNVTYDMIQSDPNWHYRILNIIIKDGVILGNGIEDSPIEFDSTGLVNKAQSKMDMLGISEGYYIDDAGEIIIDNKEKFRELIIPSVVNIIRPKAFYHCYNLTSVDIGKNVKVIGYEAFKYCKSLREIEIPGNVKTIGDGAFEHCINLSKVILNEGIEEIGDMAFGYCNSIKEITLPKSIKKQAEIDFDRIFGYSDIKVNLHIQFRADIEKFKKIHKLNNAITKIGYYR